MVTGIQNGAVNAGAKDMAGEHLSAADGHGGYLSRNVDRDRFVIARRGPRPPHDPWRHQGIVVDDEPAGTGDVVRIGTVFLTGRECPWRCVMCDLWRHTTATDTPRGAIPRQIADAVAMWRRADEGLPAHVKLYNAGSFFDPRAVPVDDDEAIAAVVAPFSRVIVESHPALVGARTWRFRDALQTTAGAPSHGAALEVAMGLETAHPHALAQLHKRMTLDGFEGAARALAAHGVGLRVFLLVHPPFVPHDEQDEWLCRSIDRALACGASVVSLIPTRSGNGAIDDLARAGLFTAPRLADLERSFALALEHTGGPRVAGGRVFADLWDLEQFAGCAHCLPARRDRLRRMNVDQRVHPAVACVSCSGTRP